MAKNHFYDYKGSYLFSEEEMFPRENVDQAEFNTCLAPIVGSVVDSFATARVDFERVIKVFTGLLNYALPKQAPTTPDDMLEKEKKMMQELLLSMPEEMIDRVAKRLVELNQKEKNENKTK